MAAMRTMQGVDTRRRLVRGLLVRIGAFSAAFAIAVWGAHALLGDALSAVIADVTSTWTEVPEESADLYRMLGYQEGSMVDGRYRFRDLSDYRAVVAVIEGPVVDARIAGDLRALLDAACEAGYDPFVRSGFRTRGEQQAILADRIAGYEAEGYGPEEARRLAGEWVAQPGTSEHELGLAVDLNDRADSDGLYAWLSSHAADFGFIQRYPDGTAAITGIAHEPWHYRYVGVEAAREISSRGITLEEYLGAA